MTQEEKNVADNLFNEMLMDQNQKNIAWIALIGEHGLWMRWEFSTDRAKEIVADPYIIRNYCSYGEFCVMYVSWDCKNWEQIFLPRWQRKLLNDE